MSFQGSHYAMTCRGPDVPYVCLHKTTSNEQVESWDENNDLVRRMAKRKFPEVRRLEVPVPGTEQKAQVSNKTYGLVMGGGKRL